MLFGGWAMWQGQELRPLVQRLNDAQIERAADDLIKSLDHSPTVGLGGLCALAPRLKPVQARRVWEAAFPMIVEGRKGQYYGLSPLLVVLSPRLAPEQVRAYVAGVITTLENPPDDRRLQRAIDGLKGLAARLEAVEVKRAATACTALVAKSPETGAQGLAALAPRIDHADIKRSWAALIAVIQKAHREDAYGVGQAVKEFAGGLPADEIAQADVLLSLVTNPGSSEFTQAVALDGIVAIAPRLASSQVDAAWTALVETFIRSGSEGEVNSRAAEALKPLASRVSTQESGKAYEKLFGALRSGNLRILDTLGVLITRFGATKVNEASDNFIAHFADGASDYGRYGLLKVASQLDEVRAKRAWDVAIAARPSANRDQAGELDELLGALAPRLERAQRDEPLIKAAEDFFNVGLTIDRELGAEGDLPFLSSISSPQTATRLLSHPGCIGEARQRLLRRFEELVFYDGRPVFQRPDRSAPGVGLAELDTPPVPPESPTPPRRFHTAYDAAEWIQKHSPAFDLDTNCPATSRGLH
jgi:hypothetical protein